MTNNPALIDVKKNVALEVIGHMLDGMTMKAACDIVGTSTQAFGKTISDYPDLLSELNKIHIAKVSTMMQSIYSESEKNLQALIDYCATLRNKLADTEDLLIDKTEVTNQLMKVDKHIQSRIAKLAPIMAKAPAEQRDPDQKGIIDAERILRDFTGPDLKKVTFTVTAERTDLLTSDGEVIDATPDETPSYPRVPVSVPHQDQKDPSDNA